MKTEKMKPIIIIVKALKFYSLVRVRFQSPTIVCYVLSLFT